MGDGRERSAPLVDRRLARLREELDDERLPLSLDGVAGRRLLEEIDYARSPRVHEGHVPIYGSLVFRERSRAAATGPQAGHQVSLEGVPLPVARGFADGRGAFLVRSTDPSLTVACFAHSVEYEANLVELARDTGAHVVQRTARGHVKVFTPVAVVTWDGVRWLQKPHAANVRRTVLRLVADCDEEVLDGLLALSVHWLSPGFRGATLVWSLHRPTAELAGIDRSPGFSGPRLDVTRREEYSSLFSIHSQVDGATLVEPSGVCAAYGATLLPTRGAQRTVPAESGTRHTSARRFSFDHPGTVLFVVSEDGPVSVYVDGAKVALAQADAGWRRRPEAEDDEAGPEDRVRCGNCGRTLVVDVPVGRDGDGQEAIPCPVCEAPAGPVATGAVTRGVSTPDEQRRADRPD